MLFATAPEDPTRFLPLSMVLLLAFLVPILLARFRRMPVVVGEIVAGMIVGPSILGWVSNGPILTFMSDIGLAFLMFLAGLEIDFSAIFPRNPSKEKAGGVNVVRVAFIVYLLTLALAVPGVWLMNVWGLEGDFWLLVFVLSATSLGVLLPVLKERDMLGSAYGRVIFINAMLADFITVLVLTFYLITLDKGFNLEVFSIGLLFLAFAFFYQLGPGFVRLPAVRRFFEELSRATVQIKVRGAIAILMFFVVMAEFLGAELILGAFLGGMIISLLKGPDDEGLIHKLEAFGFGFFIPVFFILVGVDLDLRALTESPDSLLFLPALLVIALLVKVVPMLVSKKYFSWREVIGGGLLLNTHLSLEVAVAVIGTRTGLFDAATSTTVILFAVITVLVMPFLFGYVLPHVQKKIVRYTLIVGANDLGIRVAEQLRGHGDTVKFLDDDPAKVAAARQKGFTTFEPGNALSRLESLDPTELTSVLVLGEDEQENLKTSCKAKSLGVSNVIALARDPNLVAEFQQAGVKPFTPAIERATMISMMARNPDALAMLTSTTDERDIHEIQLSNPALHGKQLRSLKLPGDMLVLAIRRGNELMIPRGNTVLEMGDKLTILGDLTIMPDVQNWLEGYSSHLSYSRENHPETNSTSKSKDQET